MSTSTQPPSILDILLQVIEQAFQLLQKVRPIVDQLRSNEQVIQALKLTQDLYAQLPESVSLAMTVAAIFLSSLMVFRVGRSFIGFLVTLIQLAVMGLVAFVAWQLRDPLIAWLDQVLNQ